MASEAQEIIFLDPALRLFDELSILDSEVSVLSDPFSDEDFESIQTTQQDLVGKDVFNVFNFSPTFKNILENVGPRASGINTMMAETPDQIRARNVFTQVKKRVPLMAQIKIVNLLNNKDVCFGEEGDVEPEFVPDEKKTWEDIKDEVFGGRNILKNIRRLTEKEKNRKILKAQADLEAYETLSGYWRLLTGYTDFKISPPDYDAYGGPCPHWLETEPITWTVMEDSRSKVLAWLAKHFRTY